MCKTNEGKPPLLTALTSRDARDMPPDSECFQGRLVIPILIRRVIEVNSSENRLWQILMSDVHVYEPS